MTTLADPNSLNYEEAVRELEQIINALETSQASLDETLSFYERGQALARRCSELLEQAELRLRQLGTGEA